MVAYDRMTLCTFSLNRTLLDELAIELSGGLDENAALLCEREVRTHLNQAKGASLRVLWDLRALDSYTIPARDVLVRLQCFLGEKANRTVYVAARSEPRSLAVWVLRMSQHRDGHVARDLEDARAWLRERCDPPTGQHARGPNSTMRPIPQGDADVPVARVDKTAV